VWDVRVKERASACMKPIEGTMAHDCWTVAFGRSNLEGQVVSTYLSKRRSEEIIIKLGGAYQY